MPNVIFVTGATGHVGSQIVKRLIASHETVRMGMRSKPAAQSIQADLVEAVEFDYDKPSTIEVALKGVTSLYLMCPLSPKFVEQTSRAIEIAKAVGVQYIVMQSAMNADLKPGIQGGRLHRHVEEAIEASGLAYTFLRPNKFMQNCVDRYGNDIRKHNAIIAPAGNSQISFIDTGDIASVATIALTSSEHKGKAYTLTGPEALSFTKLAEVLSKVLGRTISYDNLSESDFRQRMAEAGEPNDLVEMTLEGHRADEAGLYSLVTQSVEQVTGNKPIPFELFAQKHADDFQ